MERSFSDYQAYILLNTIEYILFEDNKYLDLNI